VNRGARVCNHETVSGNDAAIWLVAAWLRLCCFVDISSAATCAASALYTLGLEQLRLLPIALRLRIRGETSNSRGMRTRRRCTLHLHAGR
jgi:hypothetical protein